MTFLAGMLLLLPSCSIEDVEVKRIENAEIISADELELFFNLDVVVHNPNSMSFKLTGADVDLTVNGKPLGRTQLVEKVNLPAKETKTATVKLRTDLDKPLEEFMSGMFFTLLTGELQLRFEGEIKGRCCLVVTKKFPVDHTEKIDVGTLGI